MADTMTETPPKLRPLLDALRMASGQPVATIKAKAEELIAGAWLRDDPRAVVVWMLTDLVSRPPTPMR